MATPAKLFLPLELSLPLGSFVELLELFVAVDNLFSLSVSWTDDVEGSDEVVRRFLFCFVNCGDEQKRSDMG